MPEFEKNIVPEKIFFQPGKKPKMPFYRSKNAKNETISLLSAQKYNFF